MKELLQALHFGTRHVCHRLCGKLALRKGLLSKKKHCESCSNFNIGL